MSEKWRIKMNAQLTNQEKQFVDRFLGQYKHEQPESRLKYFLTFTFFSLTGLFLIVYSSILTLNNMVDRVIKWVFLPGIISGALLILAGFVIWQFYKKNTEKQKLAAIIQKLI
jgi:hypothetical protein